ncbi:MAG TPA: ATP-binding protein, partial [Treponemataceae bacterium]|nr:ATP-binding protein [Treponemataceae bacterium]
ISIAVINGITITDPVIQKKEITGSLPDQIDTAVSFLQLFSPEPLIVKDKAQREETTAVSIKVLREAVVNAVCHRDYSILNRKIHIFIYKNRIEIQSPGRIANTLTLSMIKAGNSAPRNIFLLKLLDNLHYIDGLGRGIPLIIKEMKDRVLFNEDGELFTVVLYF